jgi:hypothetical protein
VSSVSLVPACAGSAVHEEALMALPFMMNLHAA